MGVQLEGETVAKRRPYGSGSVTQRPDGKWVARVEAGWTDRGTRRRISRVRATEAEAKRALRDLQRELAEGTAVGGRKVTVKAWADEWLETQARRVRPKTHQTDTSTVRRWIIPTIGHRRLADLTPADVRKLTDTVRDAGRASTTARYAQSVLERMLRAAIREGHDVPERVLLTHKPAAAVSDREALTVPEAVKVLGAASKRPDGARWVAALLQGMRQGECLGLTWDHVDFNAHTIDVSWQLQTLRYEDRDRDTFLIPDGYEARRLEGAWHLTRPKTARGQRIIPMLDWMVEPLRAWREVAPVSPHGLVWPRPDGKPRNSKADRGEWWELCDEAGVRHPNGRRYHLHEARNTTASLLLAAKVEPTIITAILGHSRIVVSRGYMSIDREQLREALSAASALLLPAGS